MNLKLLEKYAYVFTWYFQIKSGKFNANIYNNTIETRKDISNIFFYYRLLFKN